MARPNDTHPPECPTFTVGDHAVMTTLWHPEGIAMIVTAVSATGKTVTVRYPGPDVPARRTFRWRANRSQHMSGDDSLHPSAEVTS